MWETKQYIILLTLILPLYSYGQQRPTHVWGITYAPCLSGGKNPSGVATGYPPDLKRVAEPKSFSNHISVFNRKQGAWLAHQREIGFSNFIYRDKFYWEPVPNLAYLNGKYNFNFITGRYSISKAIKIKSVVLSPEIGLIGVYLLSAKHELTYKYFDRIYTQSEKITVDKFNYGFSAGIKIGIPLSTKFNLEFCPVYKHFLKSYYSSNFPLEKVLYAWGLDISVVYHR